MPTLTDIKNDLIRSHRRSGDTNFATECDARLQEAVRHFAGKRWWFNEIEDTTSLTTAAGQEYYDLPATISHVDTVSVTVSQDPYTLTPRSAQYMQQRFTPSNVYTGKPADYTVFQNQIRMYPIPDAAYPVQITGYGPKSLAVDDATSPWANEAGDLIKSRTGYLLNSEFLRDDGLAAIYAARERQEFKRLRAENAKRVTRGRLAPWNLDYQNH